MADSTWSNDLVDVLRAADQTLREAKVQGRDCLVIADPAPALETPSPSPAGDEQTPTAALLP